MKPEGSSRSKPRCKYQTVWSWPPDVEAWLAPQLVGLSLHVCSGASHLGRVRLDADLAVKPDVLADMLALPFRSQIFDTVLSDPPWFTAWHLRPQIGYELRDVTQPGGTILFNCNWGLHVKGLELENITLGLPSAAYRSCSIFWRLRKVVSQWGWSKRRYCTPKLPAKIKHTQNLKGAHHARASGVQP